MNLYKTLVILNKKNFMRILTLRASKMVQPLKASTTKPGDLSSTSGLTGGDNKPQRSSSDPHTCARSCAQSGMSS